MAHAHGSKADLLINGTPVGRVTVKGFNGSWTFGDFEPFEAFSGYAPIFGTWSLLMHADADSEPISPAAKDELRQTEIAMLRSRMELLFPETNERQRTAAVNIDGNLIEWKEF